MSKRIFTLDAGHGGKDSGAVGHGLKEKNLVLTIVKLAKEYIEQHYDVDCRLTRSNDASLSLAERTNLANSNGSECCVSVHVNSAADARANGFESFVYTTDGPSSKSVKLQNIIHSALGDLWEGYGRRDRGMKKANFHMVREFKGAAVLVEFGFIVNSHDSELLKDNNFLTHNALTLAEAIADYLNLKKRVSKKDNVYSVTVDAKQVGAYAVLGNITNQVEAAIKTGSEHIEIKLVN